ncbi:MAG: hypothetical protein V1808_00450 [Candidatus Daviesbacteria bacterium]
MSITRYKIVISFLLLVLLGWFLFQPKEEYNFSFPPMQWITYSSNDLGFTTLIPNTWGVGGYPKLNVLLVASTVKTSKKSDRPEDDSYYKMTIQKLLVEGNEPFVDYYFSKSRYGENRDKFLTKEVNGEYTVYRTNVMTSSRDSLEIFITKDGKNFIKYILYPYLVNDKSKNQAQMMEYVNKIINSTKI